MKLHKIFVLILFLFIPFFAFAEDQTNTNENTETKQLAVVIAEAGKNKNVAVGRSVLFDASGSTGPEGVELKYVWDFGDGNIVEGIDATHIYNSPGTYKVSLKVTGNKFEDEDSVIVSVEKDLIILITDTSTNEDTLKELEQYAHTKNILLVTIQTKRKEADYLAASKLAQKIIEQEDDLAQSDLIISWTEGNTGLNALTELANIYKEQDVNLKFGQKGVAAITEQNLSAAGRIAQGTYNNLQPKYIVLTNPEYIKNIIDAKTADNVIEQLNQAKAPYQRIGIHSQRGLSKLNPFNIMSYGINYMVNKGVGLDTIYLILVLPIIATIVAFARQIIGIKAFGIYIPSILALALLITTLKYGLFIFAFLIIAGTLARLIAKRLKLLYLPRMAIVLTIVSLAIFGVYIAAAYFNRLGFTAVAIFPIIIMILITEKFIEAQIEKGAKNATILTLETLAISILTYFLVSWETFKTLLLAYPELILLTFIINYLIGRFTGLRLLEYFRFRKIFQNANNTKK
ncbi:MAG: 7TM domain-containing protein [Patescibacteria group bacterium]